MFSYDKELDRSKIGHAIQYFREKYNISQSTLCKGLCSVATLSRIEAGEREADGYLLEALLARMGKTPNKFELILTESDYESYQIRDEIEKYIEQKNVKAAMKLLQSYKANTSLRGKFHEQFIKRTEARLHELQGGPQEHTLELLTEAISYTVPGFKTNRIKNYYLSYTELEIIIEITQKRYDMGMSKRARVIIFQLLEYMDSHYSLEILHELYPRVAIIACTIFLQEEEYERALDVCNKGIEKNKSSRKLDYRGELSQIKAQTLEAMLKKDTNWKSRQKEFLRWYLQAYYVFQFTGEDTKAGEIRAYLQEEYPWVNID